jgi:hypothetical protein
MVAAPAAYDRKLRNPKTSAAFFYENVVVSQVAMDQRCNHPKKQ